MAKLHAAFVDGQVALITQQPSKSGTAVAPLAADAPASQRNLLVLYSSGMIALRPDVCSASPSPGRWLSLTFL